VQRKLRRKLHIRSRKAVAGNINIACSPGKRHIQAQFRTDLFALLFRKQAFEQSQRFAQAANRYAKVVYGIRIGMLSAASPLFLQANHPSL
jgi:hypothetical protein